MELKNKIDWQVKNLQECGLSIVVFGRNEFKVTAADEANFAYYWTKKEPKTFENTSRNGKKYFVLAWKFDNVSKWVSIPTFKKIMVEDWYLIALDRKFTNSELIKELDQAAKGYDDVEPFVMKNDIYIKSLAKNNKDITKLNDAIAKNNDQLSEAEKVDVVKENKEKRAVAKAEHKAKMEKLQENIKNIRKEELIKKISDLQNIAVEKLNSEEIVNHLENNDGLTITDIETYFDRIIDQNFEKPFLSNDLLIYLIKGISLIATQRTLTLEQRNIKVDKYLLDKYTEALEINDIDANDEALDEEENATDEIVKEAIKKVFHIGKKINLNKVLLILDENGINDVDVLKVTKYIENTDEYATDTVYKDEDELATAIEFIFKSEINK